MVYALILFHMYHPPHPFIFIFISLLFLSFLSLIIFWKFFSMED